jgi:hypothetical protein
MQINPDCAICLDPILPAANLTLTCDHSFHLACIKNWMNSSVHQAESAYHKPKGRPTCPLCQRTIETLDSKQAIAPALKVLVPPHIAAQNRAAALAQVMLPPNALRYAPGDYPSVADVSDEAHIRENAEQDNPSFLQSIGRFLGKDCWQS